MKDNRLKIGIDVDGVLSDFLAEYRKICMDIVGRELPIESLDWDQSNWQMTKEQHKEAWEVVNSTPNFYYDLELEKGVSTSRVIELNSKYRLYFITTRPNTLGDQIEVQTSRWLDNKLYIHYPTVIVAKFKGPIVNALELDAFIDDGLHNILDIAECSPSTELYVRDQLYNRSLTGVDYTRVKDFNEFADLFGV